MVKIQAFFRASRAQEEYRQLGGWRELWQQEPWRVEAPPPHCGLLSLFSVRSDTPPLWVVRKFIHLLDLGDGDIREEAELLRLREEVVRSIRFNRQLEEDLNLMDLKIGLLVRNKATLQVQEPAADPDLPGLGVRHPLPW